MPRPVHFEIHAEDPERAIVFYSSMFSWSFTKWDGPWTYWLVDTGNNGPGINGGLMKRMGPSPADGQPVNASVMTVEVPSCDAAVSMALKGGGTIALPKMPLPGMGWLAYLKDTEGNIFGVMEYDTSAA